MATMLKVKMRWSGFTGSPGYSNFYFREFSNNPPTNADADEAVDRVETFITNVKSLLPNVVNLAAEADVEVIEETTGALQNVLQAVPAAAQAGTGGVGNYAAAVGAVITWRTAGVRNGRRIRGRTFLVPLYNSMFSTDGSLASTTVTTLNTAATNLLATTSSPDFGVWARPTGPGATDGIWYLANSASVPDMSAVLRSRRD